MIELSPEDQRRADGRDGALLQFMQRLVNQAALAFGADRLIDVSFAHIDACHFNGQAHRDFARWLVNEGARFDRVPTRTNTLPVSLLDNHSRAKADPDFVARAREVGEIYAQLGCEPVYTCATYQLPDGPQRGDHIVGSESNAVAFYNAVVGAKTLKYGDFLDVACALTGRAPFAGLHTEQGRAGSLIFDVSKALHHRPIDETFYHLLGALLGRRAGSQVPVVLGMEGVRPSPDNLKALCAAGAATGGLAHFHIVGVTQDAATLEQALNPNQQPAEVIDLGQEDFAETFTALSPIRSGPVSMVALGTPHFSPAEFEQLADQLKDRQIAPNTAVLVSTSRFVGEIAREAGHLEVLARAGVEVLFDTCTYFSPAVTAASGTVMTNSAKWAFYAPGMLPVSVAFGSLEDCVESAVRGEVTCRI